MVSKLPKEKSPIILEAYELLAMKLFESREKRDIFANLFLVSYWSKINHIYFHGDCLVFEFEKSKGNHKGEKHLGTCYVYENPPKTWLCPVILLSQYLFCYPDVLKGDVPLFEIK